MQMEEKYEKEEFSKILLTRMFKQRESTLRKTTVKEKFLESFTIKRNRGQIIYEDSISEDSGSSHDLDDSSNEEKDQLVYKTIGRFKKSKIERGVSN